MCFSYFYCNIFIFNALWNADDIRKFVWIIIYLGWKFVVSQKTVHFLIKKMGMWIFLLIMWKIYLNFKNIIWQKQNLKNDAWKIFDVQHLLILSAYYRKKRDSAICGSYVLVIYTVIWKYFMHYKNSLYIL